LGAGCAVPSQRQIPDLRVGRQIGNDLGSGAEAVHQNDTRRTFPQPSIFIIISLFHYLYLYFFINFDLF
jgi:hypothetical protein